jgi:hypothetical protein
LAVGSKPSKPNFKSVVDLGLRDVGIKNDPRRLAAHFGKGTAAAVPLVVLAAFATCVVIGLTGAGTWILAPSALALTAGVFWLAFRMAKRSPPMVVRVTAEGANQVTWLFVAQFFLLVPLALLAGVSQLLIPLVALAVVMTVLALRARGRVPELLRRLRDLLEAGESVLGDGVGLAKGGRGRREAFRLVVATDRRVLVAATNRSGELLLPVDVPYARVSRYGIEWKYWGNVGELSLTLAEVGGEPCETHVITNIAPANLLSIARALHSHGVRPDDPEALSEAERDWEEAQRPPGPRKRLFDRQAMSTREFDRGLWLLLGVSVAVFWVAPLGLGVSIDQPVLVLLIVVALCVICGYVSRTRSSLAYIVPLNLLVVPTFFFVSDADSVIAVMIALSAVAAVSLAAGAALARARTGHATAPARGSLRYALSGLGLTRISGILLAVVVGLVAVAATAGFDSSMLRLAIEEATAKQVSVDGRSNLTGNAASLTYTPGPDLKELITDEDWGEGPNDGARWELRASFTKGYNVVSLAHYIFVEPRLDHPAAVADFVADKDREHSRIAGHRVTHTERVVDGRKGYAWNHRSRDGHWQYAAWFPQPVHTVRVECIAKRLEGRFRGLCAEAIRSLKFH